MTPKEYVEQKQGKIIFTEEEKEEFDELKESSWSLYHAMASIKMLLDYQKLQKRLFGKDGHGNNQPQLEFARAWAHHDLIVVKDPEPRFAYELKPEIKKLFPTKYIYMGLDEYRWNKPKYHTAKEWQQVDNKIKVAFKRVYEMEK
ncbi:MAG: hypothetical protein ABF899_01575 [Oenococcus sp.]|uniref:hypothetical protein n=1 Tax=Oenococcus sp. TaxID=1979414 RepID=UPI0039EBF0AF